MNRREHGYAPPTSDSEEVRDFYERFPYPAPLTSLDEHRELYKNPDRRRAEMHLLWPAGESAGKQEILVAGCGTSQAARYALREPHARVTAIDISETSLRYSRDLQRKYKLDNLEIHQLPIENIDELGRSFHLIVCTGVLHHLPDPDFGLRALRDVLNPEGAMRLMVYARHGRAGIYIMQEYCRLLGIGTTEDELRDLSAILESLAADHPVAGALQRAKDFRRPEAIADALLHPRDRAYTVPQVYAWLEHCGMSFGRWVEQAPYLPQCGTVARGPHAARLAGLPSRAQHAAMELFRGTMVTHSFVAYRDDRPADPQPVTFTGEAWRDYVPIALPWTVCLREHTPPGSVAVLINRAHTFSDLICTVDPFEERLLAVIDGKRTLGESVRHAEVDHSRTRKAVDFFQKLWRYDQIVFDLSRHADPNHT